ncbi:MAG: hypothetical protein CMJ30_04065 [Phycisphaerae bacterium]|nr:hypothetical protein [Phycisphaerae bacterium]
MHPARTRSALLALCLGLMAGWTSPARGQDAATLLEEFVHYTNIARTDLASGYAEQLLNTASATDLALVVDGPEFDRDRLDTALQRASRVDSLEVIAGELTTRIESGRLALARDPQRIQEAVQMMAGTLRQRMIAERRLEAAGEYAVPALLGEIISGKDTALALSCRDLIVKIGRTSVYPLCVAMESLDAATQQTICGMLTEIGYEHAVPALRALAEDTLNTMDVRTAAEMALRSLGANTSVSLSAAWADLSVSHFKGFASLLPYPADAENMIWAYDDFTGLQGTPVATEIYHSIRSMQAAARSVALDPNNDYGVALYAAANLRRENRAETAGVMDPVYGDQDRSPQFYATVFGTGIGQQVLALGLGDNDTALVRDALAALAITTGDMGLFSGEEFGGPLRQALRYPDRRVQIEAAIIVAEAQPRANFGDEPLVMAELSNAIRGYGQPSAVVVAATEEDAQVASAGLVEAGYAVFASATSVDGLAEAMTDASVVDLVVMDVDASQVDPNLRSLRASPRTAASPVLVLATGVDLPAMRAAFPAGGSVMAIDRNASGSGRLAAMNQLMAQASGGMLDETAAMIYAIEATEAVNALAAGTRGEVLDPKEALSTYLDALQSRSGGLRMLIAEGLSTMDSPEAQVALIDAALDASGSEQIELLTYATASVRSFGNQTTSDQVASVLSLVELADDSDLADAAAALHGALDLPGGAVLQFVN